MSKRRKRSGALRWLVVVLAVTGIAYGISVGARDPRLALADVTVVGARHTSAAQVLLAAALRPGQNVWLLDAGGAARRVQRLPWVASARVYRAWPNKVTLKLTERTPAARVALPDGGTAEEPAKQEALVDDALHVLDAGAPVAEMAGLPLLRITPMPPGIAAGGDARGTDIEEAYDALLQLRALGLHISEVDVAPATGIAVSTASGMRVILGSNDDLAKKVSLYEAIAPKIAVPEDVVYVDLRSVRAPTVLYR